MEKYPEQKKHKEIRIADPIVIQEYIKSAIQIIPGIDQILTELDTQLENKKKEKIINETTKKFEIKQLQIRIKLINEVKLYLRNVNLEPKGIVFDSDLVKILQINKYLLDHKFKVFMADTLEELILSLSAKDLKIESNNSYFANIDIIHTLKILPFILTLKKVETKKINALKRLHKDFFVYENVVQVHIDSQVEIARHDLVQKILNAHTQINLVLNSCEVLKVDSVITKKCLDSLKEISEGLYNTFAMINNRAIIGKGCYSVVNLNSTLININRQLCKLDITNYEQKLETNESLQDVLTNDLLTDPVISNTILVSLYRISMQRQNLYPNEIGPLQSSYIEEISKLKTLCRNKKNNKDKI
jgi:hypothetical protein